MISDLDIREKNILPPTIIVLLSTYNGEKYLKEQIESILQQTLADNIWIIVRDDGSSDDTLCILEMYRKREKLSYYQGKNIGSAKSFHELLRNSPQAEYYAFADQDDIWLPHKLENAIKAMKNKKGPLLYGTKKIVVDEKLQRLDNKDTTPQLDGPLNVFLHRNEISGCTICINNKLRLIYLQGKHITEGAYHDSWLVKLASLFGEIVFSEEAQILYRQHDNNVVGIQNSGKQLFFQRMKNFDFTLKKYRKRRFISDIAKDFLNNYEQILSLQNQHLLYSIAHIHSSWRCRVQLFLMPGFSPHPLYEYCIYKSYMLLGWY